MLLISAFFSDWVILYKLCLCAHIAIWTNCIKYQMLHIFLGLFPMYVAFPIKQFGSSQLYFLYITTYYTAASDEKCLLLIARPTLSKMNLRILHFCNYNILICINWLHFACIFNSIMWEKGTRCYLYTPTLILNNLVIKVTNF